MNRFGLFLVMQGIATPEQVIEALNRQRDIQRPVGRIAMEHNMLSMAQVFDILNWQAESGGRFCEIGIELGCLTDAQAEHILELQKSSLSPIGGILVEMGVLDSETLSKMLVLFEQKKCQHSGQEIAEQKVSFSQDVDFEQ